MKSYQSALLCVVYALYLVLGAVIFMFIEYEEDEIRQVTEPPQWTRLKDIALSENPPWDTDELQTLAGWLPRACPTLAYTGILNKTTTALSATGSQVEAVLEVERKCPHLHVEELIQQRYYHWSFIDGLYFAMTVTTTIGYGYHSPVTSSGRVVCILYSLVGIPLTGILLAWTSEFFAELLFKLYKSRLDEEKQNSNLVIGLATTVYVAMGFLVFIFLPAIVFSVVEDWSYLSSVYYAYITLTTIGFGDLVTGTNMEGVSLYVYQICVILWIMIGLGYWVMVANFIAKALKSKHLRQSVKRSAGEVKKLMEQMGIKHHDPTFLRQHSKATVNLMLQLSNIIAVQGRANTNLSLKSEGEDSGLSSSTPTSPSSPPLMSPIPGISALFGAGLARSSPLSNLMGPIRKEDRQTVPHSPVEDQPLVTEQPPDTPYTDAITSHVV